MSAPSAAPTAAYRNPLLAAAVVHALAPTAHRRLAVKHANSGRRSVDLETYLEALVAATGYTDRRFAWSEVHGPSLIARLRPWTITAEDRDALIDLTLTALMAADDETPHFARLSLENDVEEVLAVLLRAMAFLAGAETVYRGTAIA